MPKILIIRFGAMGDLIHVSGSLQQLKTQRPDADLTLLTAPGLLPLAQQFTGVKQVIPHSPKSTLKDWWKLAATLRHQRFDHVINLQPSLKSQLLAALIGAKPLGRYRKQKLPQKGVALRTAERLHAVEDFYRVFQQAYGLTSADRQILAPHISLAPASPAVSLPYTVLIPGVGHQRPNRAWPVTRYKELASRLLAEYPDLQLQIVGGPEECELAEQIARMNPERIRNTCGQLALLETATVLHHAGLVMGGDTGPMHLAAALGRPCIGLFGPTDIQRTGLLGQPGQTVIHLTPPAALPCWPCEKPRCTNNPAVTDTCLETLPVEKVLNAACRILNRL